MASLRKLAESYQAMNAAHMANQGAGGDASDEVPDVVSEPVLHAMALVADSHLFSKPTNFDEAGDKKDGEPEVEKLD